MSKIEKIKTYSGQDLDQIFFRPMLTGESAEELGIKVMYNMPVPTTLHFWRRNADVLQRYTTGGWSGGGKSDKFQKTIQLHKVKAEMAYGADDYFSTVYELITGRSDVNLDDLSGTELEAAETALFRQSIAEGIRSTMWLGNTTRSNPCYNTFDGVMKNITDNIEADCIKNFAYIPEESENWGEKVLKNLWDNAPVELKELRSEGQLAYFVTSDIYNAYEESLDNVAIEAAYLAKQTGREGLYYRGIPVIDVKLNGYFGPVSDLPHSFGILTDRRNIALAVNTNDFPGTEVRMWYNPDVMENRQRAIFMAGCDYLLPELLSVAVGIPFPSIDVTCEDGIITISGAYYHSVENWIAGVRAFVVNDEGVAVVDDEDIECVNDTFLGEFEGDSVAHCSFGIITKSGAVYHLI